MKKVTLFAQPDGRTMVREEKQYFLPTDTTTFTNADDAFEVKYTDIPDALGFDWEEKSLNGKPIQSATLKLGQSYAEVTVPDDTEIA